MDEDRAGTITAALSEIIKELMPDAVMIEKYGGVVVERVPGQPKSQACGFFVYAHHVSLEFTKGTHLKDPDGILEGSGKQRRHIKLKTNHDIKAKRCRDFVEQASKR